MTDFVTITHPDIVGHGRVARTALPYLDPRWRIVGEPAAATHAAQDDSFDPGDHVVSDVLDHLQASGVQEQQRVLALEAEGKARSTVLAFTPNAEPEPTA